MVKNIAIFIFDIILYLFEWIISPIVGVINYFVVRKNSEDKGKGYFRNSALNVDIFASQEFRAFWNSVLIKTIANYKFGVKGETLSSALGKFERSSLVIIYKFRIYFWYKKYWTLKYRYFAVTDYTLAGIFLNRVLNIIHRNHCIKSINDKI